MATASVRRHDTGSPEPTQDVHGRVGDGCINLDATSAASHTFGMKTAVSIPDDVFEDAERLAQRLQTSRSNLYARALSEFVARHDSDHVTALMDQAVRDAGEHDDAFVQAAAQQTMKRAEW
jgi:predicted transcriptional regulator